MRALSLSLSLSLSLWILPALLLTVGCDGSDSKEDDGSGFGQAGTTGTDATDDTGSGGATDDGTTESRPDDGPCPAWLGFTSADVTWEYDYLEPDLDVEYIVTLDAYADGAGVLLETQTYDVDGDTHHTLTTTTFYCDAEGFWVTDRTSTYTTDPDDDAAAYAWNEVLYDEPILELPRSLTVGDSWSVFASGVTNSHTGYATKFSLQVEYVADTTESLTVPAGTYDTLRVETVTANGPNVTLFNTLWYVWDVGLIATGLTEMVDHTP